MMPGGPTSPVELEKWSILFLNPSDEILEFKMGRSHGVPLSSPSRTLIEQLNWVGLRKPPRSQLPAPPGGRKAS
jgi:hypothetical protein